MSGNPRVRVGRIVLDGFARHEHAAILAAVEASLANLSPEQVAGAPRLEVTAAGPRPSDIGGAVTRVLRGGRR